MEVDEVGRVHLLQSIPLLHPEQQVLADMLQGWRNRQLSRNLQFATISPRIRYVQRFIEHMNVMPWEWTPRMVEEYFGDLRSIRRLSHASLRAHQSALRDFTSYIQQPGLWLGPGLRGPVRDAPGTGLLRVEHGRARARVRRPTGQTPLHQARATAAVRPRRQRGRPDRRGRSQGLVPGLPRCGDAEDRLLVTACASTSCVTCRRSISLGTRTPPCSARSGSARSATASPGPAPRTSHAAC